MELIDGWNIKTVYKSTMAHQQCPIAGKQADGPGSFYRKKGSDESLPKATVVK
jgi:hypothetical protein